MAFECLICGKSNFAVNDGKARCKDCGMEYSLEDIMKATLSYSSVTTEKIDGQMKNAEREYSIGHYQKAADILTSVLSIQPDNTEALYRSRCYPTLPAYGRAGNRALDAVSWPAVLRYGRSL